MIHKSVVQNETHKNVSQNDSQNHTQKMIWQKVMKFGIFVNQVSVVDMARPRDAHASKNEAHKIFSQN